MAAGHISIFTFTFHNVSIKTYLTEKTTPFSPALHSTMFLLKPILAVLGAVLACALHSTMFLLKLEAFQTTAAFTIPFTFHNVSIKTL